MLKIKRDADGTYRKHKARLVPISLLMKSPLTPSPNHDYYHPQSLLLTDELPVANFIVGPKRQQYSMVTYLAMEGHSVINDFTHSSFGNFGGMGNKGEREDFQSPSSGGALF